MTDYRSFRRTALGVALLTVSFGVATTPALAGLVEVNGLGRGDGPPFGVVVSDPDAGSFNFDQGTDEVGIMTRPNELFSEESRSGSSEGPDFDNREMLVGIGAGDVFFFDPGDGSDRPAAKAVPLPPAIWTGLPMLGAAIACQLAWRRMRRVT